MTLLYLKQYDETFIFYCRKINFNINQAFKKSLFSKMSYQLLYGGHLYSFFILIMSVSLRFTFLPKLVWFTVDDLGVMVSIGSSPNGFFENALSE